MHAEKIQYALPRLGSHSYGSSDIKGGIPMADESLHGKLRTVLKLHADVTRFILPVIQLQSAGDQ